jgi:hypothetical protein
VYLILCCETRQKPRSHESGPGFEFADFNLTAPSRMMGMIKVEDKLEVMFNLALKVDPEL